MAAPHRWATAAFEEQTGVKVNIEFKGRVLLVALYIMIRVPYTTIYLLDFFMSEKIIAGVTGGGVKG